MASVSVTAYDKLAEEIEQQLLNQFPDIKWKVARYSELSEETTNSEESLGMFITGGYEGKGQVVVMPPTFLNQGLYSIEGIQGTIFVIGNQIANQLHS